MYINLAYVMSFVFGYNPEATYGPAHRVGVKLEYLSILESGYEGYRDIKALYGFLFFITPHIAPYVETTGIYARWGGGEGPFSISWGWSPDIGSLIATFGVSIHIRGRLSVRQIAPNPLNCYFLFIFPTVFNTILEQRIDKEYLNYIPVR
jgi:hypothetical protein